MSIRPTESVQANERRQINEILTDFFRYRLAKKGLIWTSQADHEVSPDIRDVCFAVRELSDEFLDKHRESVERMVSSVHLHDLHMTAERAEFGFNEILESSIAEGICWPRIIGALTFAAEVAYRLECASFAEDSVGMVLRWLSGYIQRRFMPWIRTHEGWNGIIQFRNDDSRPEGATANAGWPNLNTYSLAGIALGALAIGAILTTKT